MPGTDEPHDEQSTTGSAEEQEQSGQAPDNEVDASPLTDATAESATQAGRRHTLGIIADAGETETRLRRTR